MTKGTKPGQFSPVSLEALELIANAKKDPRLLLAYLGLARHTTMRDLDGRGPNMLTGAGAEKVRVLTGCGTPMATGIVNALAGMGLIKKPAAGLPPNQARWAMQHQGTVNVPHALIDGGIGNADGIGRLLKEGATDEVVVCAVMLLINCYAVHDLEMFGGVDHQQLWRHWNHMVSPEGEGVRVTAEPISDTAQAKFISKIVGSMGGKVDENGNSDVFWKAFKLLKGTGLFYGSSRITGKDALDLHEKEFAIPITVRHPLDDLYSIVYSFQLTRVHRPANPADDAPPVAL